MTGRAEAADQVTGNITVRARVMNLFESGEVEGVQVELRDEWLGENSGRNEVGREGRRGKWWSHGLPSARGPRNFWHRGGTVSQVDNEFGLKHCSFAVAMDRGLCCGKRLQAVSRGGTH